MELSTSILQILLLLSFLLGSESVCNETRLPNGDYCYCGKIATPNTVGCFSENDVSHQNEGSTKQRLPDHGGIVFFFRTHTWIKSSWPQKGVVSFTQSMTNGLGDLTCSTDLSQMTNPDWVYPSGVGSEADQVPVYTCSITAPESKKHHFEISMQQRDADGRFANAGCEVNVQHMLPLQWEHRTFATECFYPYTTPKNWFKDDPSQWNHDENTLDIRYDQSTSSDDPCPMHVDERYCANHGTAFMSKPDGLSPITNTANLGMGSYQVIWDPISCDTQHTADVGVDYDWENLGHNNCYGGCSWQTCQHALGGGGEGTEDYQCKCFCPSIYAWCTWCGDCPCGPHASQEHYNDGYFRVTPRTSFPAFFGCKCQHGWAGSPNHPGYVNYTDRCEDCLCAHGEACHWDDHTLIPGKVCECSPDFADSRCQVNCTEKCSGQNTCTTTGGWSTGFFFDKCLCKEGTFGTHCEKTCSSVSECGTHSIDCAHNLVDATACLCELGWRLNAPLISGSDPRRNNTGFNMDGNTKYVCKENVWHSADRCNLLGTDYGVDLSGQAKPYKCYCKPGYGDVNCQVKCNTGCRSCKYVGSALLCDCSGHGYMEPDAQYCICDANYGGSNCETYMPVLAVEGCADGFQSTLRASSFSGHGDEYRSGIPYYNPDISIYGISNDAQEKLCLWRLAYDQETGRCTFGKGWDEIYTRLPGEEDWSWARRIVYRLTHGARILNKAEAQADASLSTHLLAAPLNRLTTEMARTFCNDYNGDQEMCQGSYDPYAVLIANQVMQRGAWFDSVNGCNQPSPIPVADIIDCWVLLTADSTVAAVGYEAGNRLCYISKDPFCDSVSVIVLPFPLGTTAYYFATRSSVYYRDVEPRLGMSLTLPRFNPLTSPESPAALVCGADMTPYLIQSSGKTYCIPNGLSYDTKFRLSRDSRTLPISTPPWGEDAIYYDMRIQDFFLYSHVSRDINPVSKCPGAANHDPVCFNWDTVAPGYCSDWAGSHPALYAQYCSSNGMPVVQNSLFQRGWRVVGKEVPPPGVQTPMSGLDANACRMVVLASGGVYEGAQLEDSGNGYYLCRVFTAVTGLVTASSTTWGWMVNGTNTGNQFDMPRSTCQLTHSSSSMVSSAGIGIKELRVAKAHESDLEQVLLESECGYFHFVIEVDCNVVIYTHGGIYTWSAGNWRPPTAYSQCNRLILNDKGQLEAYSNGDIQWTQPLAGEVINAGQVDFVGQVVSAENGAVGPFKLEIQPNGDLVTTDSNNLVVSKMPGNEKWRGGWRGDMAYSRFPKYVTCINVPTNEQATRHCSVNYVRPDYTRGDNTEAMERHARLRGHNVAMIAHRLDDTLNIAWMESWFSPSPPRQSNYDLSGWQMYYYGLVDIQRLPCKYSPELSTSIWPFGYTTDCGNNGVCYNDFPGIARCKCTNGYTGEWCQTPPS